MRHGRGGGGYLAFIGLFTRGVRRGRCRNAFPPVSKGGPGRGKGLAGRTPAFLCVPLFYLPTIDVRRDWQLYRLSPVFWLHFVSACHPIRQLSPGGGTNPTGHYEAGLIPTAAAAEAFQGGFWSMIPCLSHASVGLGRRLQCSTLLSSHSITCALSYPGASETHVEDFSFFSSLNFPSSGYPSFAVRNLLPRFVSVLELGLVC